jgi:hypothetical protein
MTFLPRHHESAEASLEPELEFRSRHLAIPGYTISTGDPDDLEEPLADHDVAERQPDPTDQTQRWNR